MALRGYQPYIQKACGCTDEEAQGVEEMMRLQTGGVLDHLYPDEFDRVAKVALEALRILVAEDPEFASGFVAGRGKPTG